MNIMHKCNWKFKDIFASVADEKLEYIDQKRYYQC